MRHSDRSLLGDLVWAPWSLCGWVVTLGWMALLALSALPITLFRRFETFQMTWPHPQTSWPLWFLFSPLRRHYDPGYDRKRVSMYVQNHVSMLDGVISIGSIRVPLCGLENAAHLKVPGYGWLLTMSNAIPVRKGARRYAEIAEAFRERASRGVSVVTFPEAHRTLDGKVRPFKRGVFKIARDAGLPIVPVCVRGAYRMLPKGTWIFRPSKLDVYLAPQIETKGLSDEQLDDVAERIRELMTAWIERGEKRPDLCTPPARTAPPLERPPAPSEPAPL